MTDSQGPAHRATDRVNCFNPLDRTLCKELQEGINIIRIPISTSQLNGAFALTALAQCAGSQAIVCDKRVVETSNTGKAAERRNPIHRQVRICQELLGTKQSACLQVLHRGYAPLGLKNAPQMTRSNPEPVAQGCNVRGGIRPCVGRIHQPRSLPRQNGAGVLLRPCRVNPWKVRQRSEFRPAPQTWAKSRPLCLCGQHEEPAVFLPRCAYLAYGTAINPCACNTGKELPIESAVSRFERLVVRVTRRFDSAEGCTCWHGHMLRIR